MISVAEMTNAQDIASPKNNTPPASAIIGTVNCNIAAKLASSFGNVAYQTAYPTPEASDPDATANNTPFRVVSTSDGMINQRIMPMGAISMKLPAVARNGAETSRPRKE